MKNIIRPEVEITYKGIKGFFYALFILCKPRIKIWRFGYVIKGSKKSFNTYVIPKYKLKKE